MVVFSYDMDDKVIHISHQVMMTVVYISTFLISVSSNELLIVSFLNLLTCNMGASTNLLNFDWSCTYWWSQGCLESFGVDWVLWLHNLHWF